MKTATPGSVSERMATLFLRNKYLLILSITVIFVAGLSALMSMPRLEDPRLMNRNPLIITLLPGGSASRVEALVTEKIEEELQEVTELKRIESTSRAGVSLVTVELQDRVTDNEKVFTKIRDKLKAVEDRLPPEARRPVFDDKRGATAFTLIVGLAWDRPAALQLGLLDRLAEDLSDRLRLVPGTEIVRVYGEPEEEVTVRVDPDEMVALGLNAGQVASRIRAADTKVPAGAWRGNDADLLLEVSGEIDSLQRVRDVPLKKGANGQLIRLGDLAEVAREWQNPPSEIGLADGRRAIFVAARVEEFQRVDRWMENARPVLAAFQAEVGAGVRVDTVFDQTVYTNARLAELGWNLLAGALVIVLVIFLLMGWRSALIVGSALPLTACLTLFVVASGGGALHQMSIFGMIIALGLLIDNSIVMVDEVNRQRDAGKSSREAVAATIHHLFIPLFASTMTTLLAFAPIVLLPGNIGDFVGAIGGSVIIALIGSFVIAMTVTPSLAGLLGRPRVETGSGHWWSQGLRSRRLFKRAEAGLLFGLRRPVIMALLACSLPAAGFLLAGTLGSQFFPLTDRNMFGLRMWLPTESSVSHSLQRVQAIEAQIRQHDEIQRVDWLVGGSFPTVYYNLVMFRDNAPHFAQAVLTADSSEAVKELVPRLQQELDNAFPEAQIVVRSFAQGPPVEAEVEFRLFGPAIATLQDLGDQLRLHLTEHPDVLHTRVSLTRGEPKLWFAASEEEARLAGLSLQDIAGQLQTSLEGVNGGSFVEDLEEMPVRIRFGDSYRADWRAIRDTKMSLPGQENWVPLSALGEMELRLTEGGITRYNGERVNTIRGYTRNDALPIEVTREVLQRLDATGFELPEGYRLDVGGDAEQEEQALGNLQIYLPVLLVLMIGTVVLSFRSVRLAMILGTVAFLTIGLGLLATWFSGFPVSFNSILGIAGLIGLALNDNIVVIAAIRANPQARAGNHQAIVAEVLGCSRHLIATTLTTVGGFLPLLIFVGGDFWPPLAIVLAGGVVGSTILAMLFVPSAYLLAHHFNGNSASNSGRAV